MAGAGYKLFNTGDVLTAAQVNTYLNEQTVMVFASSTARTTALSGVLAEGMMSYLQDTNAVEVYNGSSWVNVGNAGDITEVQAGVGISIASGTGPIPVITNSSTDLITTAGDLLYGTAADTMARLGIGTAGQVLKVNSGATAPEWGAVSSGATYVGVQANRNSSSQSISNTTYTAITFPSEGWDTDGFHDTSTNTSRITIPTGKGGKYNFTFVGNFNSDVTTALYTSFYKNGSALTGEGLDASGTLYNERGNADTFIGSITVDAVATDYFEIFVYQSSGGTKTLTTARLTADYLGA
jgi:hypothetical protein